MHKIQENRPEALRVGEPGEETRYAPSLQGGARTAIEGAETLTLLELAE